MHYKCKWICRLIERNNNHLSVNMLSKCSLEFCWCLKNVYTQLSINAKYESNKKVWQLSLKVSRTLMDNYANETN